MKNQDQRILLLMKIFQEQTDEKHSLTVQQLVDLLQQQAVQTDSKSILFDIATLRDFGMDIQEKQTQFYLGKRSFETAELKLLIDAIQSSKFLTLEKSQELIKKIEALTSSYEAKKLQKQVFVVNRIKTTNKEIYFNIEKIYQAIAENRQIEFHYFEYTVEKTERLRNAGQKYIVSPYALTWDDENYYLISNYTKHDNPTHFRIDKMLNIEISPEKRSFLDVNDDIEFNAADYQKRVFAMFGGTERSVTMQFDHSLVGVVLDRFGKDVFIHHIEENFFHFTIKVAVSSAFFSWIFQFGSKAKIIAPQSVVDEMTQMMTVVIDQYCE